MTPYRELRDRHESVELSPRDTAALDQARTIIENVFHEWAYDADWDENSLSLAIVILNAVQRLADMGAWGRPTVNACLSYLAVQPITRRRVVEIDDTIFDPLADLLSVPSEACDARVVQAREALAAALIGA